MPLPPLIDIANLAENQDLRKQIKGALLVACDTVNREPADTPNHEQRMVIRRRILMGLDEHVLRVFPWVISDPAVVLAAPTPADADVKRAVLEALETYL